MEKLTSISLDLSLDMYGREFAEVLDEKDELRKVRDMFEYPGERIPLPGLEDEEQGREAVYMCGSSLGLMPRKARETLDQVMDQWGSWAVIGHESGPLPWQLCDEQLVASMARLVGAQSDEVAIMNQLTVNLHLLLVAMYRPSGTRTLILHEHMPFPSDLYALESQARLHGLDPRDVMVSVPPRPGEHCVRTQDLLDLLELRGAQVALVLMSAVSFYSGQLWDVCAVTKAARGVGAKVGWDLAHAVGNVELSLHDWDVDFAVWTTYKYLNSGPGASGGAFLHSRHFGAPGLLRLEGWWGHDHSSRMDMTCTMTPGTGIRAFRVSTPSAFHCATLRASLAIFDLVGMPALRTKSVLLTGYLDLLLRYLNQVLGAPVLEVITPSLVEERGAQLSVRFPGRDVEEVYASVRAKGLICDRRKPDVLRLTACPLYNSFLDVYKTFHILRQVLEPKQ